MAPFLHWTVFTSIPWEGTGSMAIIMFGLYLSLSLGLGHSASVEPTVMQCQAQTHSQINTMSYSWLIITWSHFEGQLNYEASIRQGHSNADLHGTMTHKHRSWLHIWLFIFEAQNMVYFALLQSKFYTKYLSLVQNGLM